MSETAQLRIGELARRTGVATELLRAWERRYGLLTRTRTASGYRLYSTEDVDRVGRMRQLLGSGLSAAEAARQAARGATPAPGRSSRRRPPRPSSAPRSSGSTTRPRTPRSTGYSPTTRRRPFWTASSCRSCASSATAGSAARSRSRRSTSPPTCCVGVCSGSPAGWDRGSGPRAVLACPPGERHDLGLVIFGLALRELGVADHVPWRRQRRRTRRRHRARGSQPAGARARRRRSGPAGGGGSRSAQLSPICPRRSGSAARERGHVDGAQLLDGLAVRGGGAGRRALELEVEQVVDGLAAADQPCARRRRRALPPGVGRRCSSMPFRACRRRSRERRSGRRGAAPAAPRRRSGRRPTRSACRRS